MWADASAQITRSRISRVMLEERRITWIFWDTVSRLLFAVCPLLQISKICWQLWKVAISLTGGNWTTLSSFVPREFSFVVIMS